MSTSMPRLCLGCNRVTRNGNRCPACQQQRETDRGTPAQRGYDTAWRRLSKQAIAAQPWCSSCGTPDDLTADHIVPLAAGGHSIASNIQVLCRSHNSAKRDRVDRNFDSFPFG